MTISPLYSTYARSPLAFVSGDGPWLTTVDGERFLDFAAGIAVNALGHCHPRLVAALKRQADELWHVSNLYTIPGGDDLADRLVESTFADTMFFTNSGAEAMECAIKTARRYHFVNGAPERFRIITVEGAFHGRTLATIAAGGQEKYLEGFGPKMEGFDQVAFADPDAVEAAVTDDTAAILVEPLLGEGGIQPLPHAYLRGLRELCDKHGLLLIFDEIQCGVGRTGKLFAHEWANTEPDIMGVAKGLGSGFPLGACLATAEAAKGMTPGTHGSTFGGNPLAMAVGAEVLDIILEAGFLDHVAEMGLYLKQKLAAIVDSYPESLELVRGQGLMLGIRAKTPAGDIVNAARDHGLLLVAAGDNVVRFLPPLIIDRSHIDEAINRIDKALTDVERKRAAVPDATAEKAP